jgi:hypothetical protein
MLKTLKLSPVAIRDAILAIDDARLSTEDLVVISKQLPTPEEVSFCHLIIIQSPRSIQLYPISGQ